VGWEEEEGSAGGEGVVVYGLWGLGFGRLGGLVGCGWGWLYGVGFVVGGGVGIVVIVCLIAIIIPTTMTVITAIAIAIAIAITTPSYHTTPFRHRGQTVPLRPVLQIPQPRITVTITITIDIEGTAERHRLLEIPNGAESVLLRDLLALGVREHVPYRPRQLPRIVLFPVGGSSGEVDRSTAAVDVACAVFLSSIIDIIAIVIVVSGGRFG